MGNLGGGLVPVSFEEPPVEALPNALSNVCDDPSDATAFLSTNPIMRFAGATWQAVRGILLPEPLRAADLGLGGLTSSFSRFRWAFPAKFEQDPLPPFFEAGDNQIAPAAGRPGWIH